MHRRTFILLSIISFISLLSEAQTGVITNSNDTILFNTTLVPLEDNQPSITTDTIEPSPLDFHVLLISDSIKVEFSSISFTTVLVDSLDKFIKDNNISQVCHKIYLEAPKEYPMEKIEEIINIFKENNINSFILKPR